MDRVLDQYLSRHAEPLTAETGRRWQAGHDKRWRGALVVPCYDETWQDLARLAARAAAGNALLIAVVNAPEAAPTGALDRTRRLLSQALAADLPDLLTVDCVSAGRQLPTRQGVGLARKIGTDIASWLWRAGQFTQPWIYQTDADASLPDDYFSADLDALARGAGAITCAHRHVSRDPATARAAQLYEWHMAFYRMHLERCGSPYAYPSLGSALIVHPAAYARVRGFPKRNAAEDFYLLNKIAKVSGVTYAPTLTVELQARRSARVPFGTGPALDRIMALLETDPEGEAYHSYAPRAFELLSQTHRFLARYAETPEAAAPPAAATILSTLNFPRIADRLHSQHRTVGQRRKALHDWFDARRTLRFVHETRRYWPDAPLLASLRKLPRAEQLALGFHDQNETRFTSPG